MKNKEKMGSNFDPFGVMTDPSLGGVTDRDIEKMSSQKDVSSGGGTGEEKKTVVPSEGKEEKEGEKKEKGKEDPKSPEEGKEDSNKKEGEDENEGVADLSEMGKKKEGEEKEKGVKEKEGEKSPEEGKKDGNGGDKKGEGKEEKKKITGADIENMSDEELDAYLDEVITSASDANESLGDVSESLSQNADVKKTPEYMEMMTQLEDAKRNLDSFENEIKETKALLEKRSQRSRDLAVRLDELESDNNIAAPYIEAITSDNNLKDAIMFLARANKTSEESRKGNYKERATEALYSYMESLTGINIRDVIGENTKQGKGTVKKGEIDGGVSGANGKYSDNSPITKGILNAFG